MGAPVLPVLRHPAPKTAQEVHVTGIQNALDNGGRVS